MAHHVQNVTLALTLPITCHICLGKVRQPVICANNHVFCAVCIELWLKNNGQCPACRVPITEENPCKNIIGGTSEDEGTLTHSGRKYLRKTRFELLQKEYEEEIESLLKETEELNTANLRLEERLSAATHSAAISVSCNCKHKEAEDSRGISDSLLEDWSRKLEMANAANKKAVEDIEKLKEENQRLRNENIECIRENLRLKNEVDLRSPQKFGRYTVAALQAKVDQHERETSRLKKALERSDQYIEELEAQVEQLKRPPEDIQKEKSQSGNAARVHETDVTTTRVCQELNATQQFLSHSFEESSSARLNSNGHTSGLNKQLSLCETVGSLELKSKYSSTLENSSEPMSIDEKRQGEGGELAPGFGSPTSSLPFSSLHLNTPASKANGSTSQAHLKKPLTYLRKLVFDDLPKRKELCKSHFVSVNNGNIGEGLTCFREPTPSFSDFCQINCESGDSELPGRTDIGIILRKQKDNGADQREYPAGCKEIGALDKGCHDNVNEPICNGSQSSYHDNSTSMSGSKQNVQCDSNIKVGNSSGETLSSHQGGEPSEAVSYAPCSSSAVGDAEHSQYSMDQPAGAIQDENFQSHLPHTDILLCKPSLESKAEVTFHSAESEHVGHASQSTRLAHCTLQTYSNSPPAKRKMLSPSSDSPSKAAKP